MESNVYLLKPPPGKGRGLHFLADDVLSKLVTDTMFKIMTQWMGFPTDDKSHLQGTFTTTLLRITKSPNILLLDCVWSAHLDMERQLFPRGRSLSAIPNQLKQLRDDLQRHAIADPLSATTGLITTIGSICMPYGAIKPKLTNGLDCMRIRNFILQTLPIVNEPTPQADDDELQALIKSDLDRYLPFRELAPSRQRVCKPEGPFDPEYITTKSGIFSALIFRGITFSAPAVFEDHDNRFDDLRKWQLYADVPEKEHQKRFVNMRAYGAANKYRHPSAAVSYWAGSEALSHWLEEKERTCGEVFKYLLGKNRT